MKNSTFRNERRASFLSIIFLFLFIQNSSSQNTDAVRKAEESIRSKQAVTSAIINPERVTPSLVRLREGISNTQTDLLLKDILSMGNDDELRPLRVIELKGLVVGEKRQQYYKGIKIQYGQYNIIRSGDYVVAFSGEFYKMPSGLKTNPSINEQQALQLAMNFVAAKEYAWEQVDRLRRMETNPDKLRMLNKYYDEIYPAAEMVIIRDFFNPASNKIDLAYKFNIYAADPISRGYVFVNAHTGKIMYYDKIIKHLGPDLKKKVTAPKIIPEVQYVLSLSGKMASAVSKTITPDYFSVTSILTPLPTRYAGTRMAGTKLVSGNDPNSGLILTSSHPTNEIYVPGDPTNVLIDDTRGGGFETYDLNGIGGLPVSVPVYPQAKSFTDIDNVWTLAEHNRGGINEAENDDIAFDAHWGAGIVYDYWTKVQGRKSFDNKDGAIRSFIHSGLAYDNAFWNGSVMTYGDGSFQGGLVPGFMPLVSLDVCGHEIGHGVCSFTSDLAYQKESGAMNEGFSDIWAACIEHYALDSIDATLISGTGPGQSINGYKIFSIGEQIDANDATGPPFVDVPSSNPTSTALRYMNNPSAAGDPNSYWGANFSDPDCMPNLANDECGVHTNSGVLNHWFYYLVMGSGGAGSVETNNANNTTGALNGQPFNVTGIGFRKAERMTYLMEQLLSSNATYLEARNMTIVAAEALFGKCSFEYKQAIIAWHAVAVGSSSDTSLCATLPPFSVSVQDSVSETSAKSMTTCNNQKIISLGMSLIPPGFSNPLQVTIGIAGTATIGQDYTIQSTSITYASNTTGLKVDTIRILNDAEVEANETIVLNIHATDNAGFTKDTTVTIIISDDDDVPTIGNNRVVLLSENFDAVATGSLPAGWTSIDKLGNNIMAWRVGNGSAINPLSSFTTKSVMADLNLTPTVEPAYDPTAPVTIILRTPLIDATALTDIKVNFNWAAMGEPDPGPPVHTLDYGRIMYSTDGVNFQPFQFDDRDYGLSPVQKRDSINIPAQLANSKFYIGFVWFNDDNLAVPPSLHIDSIRVTAGPRKVETELNDGVAETQFGGKDIYYLSAQDGEVIAEISNATEDIGCITAKLTEAGTGTSNTSFSYNGFVYLRTKKVLGITPSSPHLLANYNLKLYFTTAEIGALNADFIKVMKVKDAVPLTGNVNPADAELITPVIENHSLNGYYTFSGNYTGFSQFTLVQATGPVPVNLLSFDAAVQNNRFVKLSWITSNESNIQSYVVEKTISGSNQFVAIGTVAPLNNGTGNNYSFNDLDVRPNITYEYRLRIVDGNMNRYSEIRSARIKGAAMDVVISPNPAHDIVRVEMQGYTGMISISVVNALGQPVYHSTVQGAPSKVVYIDLGKQAKGMYTVRIKSDADIVSEKILLQ